MLISARYLRRVSGVRIRDAARRVRLEAHGHVHTLAGTGADAELQYPAAARGDVVDDLSRRQGGGSVSRFEDPNAQATKDWVEAENAVSQPYLEQLPHRAWLAAPHAALELRALRRAAEQGRHDYFYMRNDGKQNQSVLYVADLAECAAARARSIRTAARGCDHRAVGVHAEPGGRVGGVRALGWRHGLADLEFPPRRATAATLPAISSAASSGACPGRATARACTTAAIRSRPDECREQRGDDAGRPDMYFHKLGDAQAADRLVYKVTDHPRACPRPQVTEDGRYLIIALFEG